MHVFHSVWTSHGHFFAPRAIVLLFMLCLNIYIPMYREGRGGEGRGGEGRGGEGRGGEGRGGEGRGGEGRQMEEMVGIWDGNRIWSI